MKNKNTKRLILGNIPQDFDAENDIPLGPFCFINKEDIYEHWEKIVFPVDPYRSTESLIEAETITSNIASSLLPKLAHELNVTNKTHFSIKFWRIMLLPWLLILIHAIYERYLRINQFVDKHKKEKITVELLHSATEWEFIEVQDFIKNGILNPEYNKWLFSRILENSIPNTWECYYSRIKKSYNNEINIKQKKNIILDNSLNKYRRCNGIYGIGFIESILWSIYLSFKPIKNKGNKRSKPSLECNKKFGIPLDLDSVIYPSLPKCYTDLKLISTPKIHAVPGRIRLIGPQIYFSEKEKYALAYCVEKGERIISTQHGGGGCALKVHPLRAEVEYKQYNYFSWGWTNHEDYHGDIIPMPSPLLTGYKDKHKELNSSLIIVGTAAFLFSRRLMSVPQSLQNLDYRKNKTQFIEKLKSNIFQNVLYRPYFNNYSSLNDRSYIEKKFPGIKICNGELHPKMLTCKLLVVDHPSTTFSIALAANVPTIGFWNKKHWIMCKQAIPCFDALEKAGITYEAGEDVADKVNIIWDDVKTWWFQPSVQKARKYFCNQYAKSSKNWRLKWAKTLWNI